MKRARSVRASTRRSTCVSAARLKQTRSQVSSNGYSRVTQSCDAISKRLLCDLAVHRVAAFLSTSSSDQNNADAQTYIGANSCAPCCQNCPPGQPCYFRRAPLSPDSVLSANACSVELDPCKHRSSSDEDSDLEACDSWGFEGDQYGSMLGVLRALPGGSSRLSELRNSAHNANV